MLVFNKEDTVRRVDGSYNEVNKGDVDTVENDCPKDGSLCLVGHGGSYDSDCFELVKKMGGEKKVPVNVGKLVYSKGEKVRITEQLEGDPDGFEGQIVTLKKWSNNGWWCIYECDVGVYESQIEKLNGGEGVMGIKKAISDNFKNTDDALVVEKHLGSQIQDDFIESLIVGNFKEEILKEAQRLEQVSLDSKKK